METLSFVSVFSSHPLFSFIVTFYTLIFLYLPHLFRKIVLSPVIILTGILLLFILRLGAIQKSEKEQKEKRKESETGEEKNRVQNQGKSVEPVETNSVEGIHRLITSNYEKEIKSEVGLKSSSRFEESFVEWNVKAPLEVIYEEYEGEETEHDANEKQDMIISRYPSLSRYYPESDSDSSSENGFPAIGKWDSPENICFRWEDEEEEERELGLIEIALDGCKKRTLEFQFEEENLIEIDISPTRRREFTGEEELFSGEISCN
ncbi:hypothetical protein Lal_00038680 [Lupinus albus]|nr:hypothetical protein Lal_00038680 [Lupinus albus]